eukprot:3934347-Ditylum_brightwellii.AAC.1
MKRQEKDVIAKQYDCSKSAGVICGMCSTFACYKCVLQVRNNICKAHAKDDTWCILIDSCSKELPEQIITIPQGHC